MVKEQCSKRVFSGERFDFRGHNCGTTATIQRDGKWWCKRHDPQEVDRKQKEKQEKWNQELRDDRQKEAKAEILLERLGVEGCVNYHWKNGYQSAVVIRFDEVERLLKILGK